MIQESVHNKRFLSASDGGVDLNLHGNNQSTALKKHLYLEHFFVQIKILCEIIHFYYFLSPTSTAIRDNILHPKILCAKFGWNWLTGSGEGGF